MSPTINMPDLPKPAANGTLRRWMKAEGESVQKGEVFLIIETERAVLELEAANAGTLQQILVPAGKTVPAGTPLAVIGNGVAATAAPSQATAKPTAAAAPKITSEAPMGKVTPILMPKAGNDMEEGTIVKWLVKEGDSVKPGSVLFELETDKATMEIESEHEGTVRRIIVPAGKSVVIHTPLAYLAESDSDVDAFIGSSGDVPAAAAPVAAAPVEGPKGKVTAILMPKAGNDMEEGTIVKWLVKEGDSVKPGNVLFELETDKATMEIESEHEGTVRRIVVPAGKSVVIHTPLAYLADSDSDVDAFIAQGGGAVAEAKPVEAPKPTPVVAAPKPAPVAATVATPVRAAGERIKASPAAKRMAREQGLDISSVAGSGANGRITTMDLAAATPAGAKAEKSAPAGKATVKAPRNLTRGDDMVREKMTSMRKAIARNLTASKQTVPHFYMKLTIDALRLLAAQKRQKAVCRASLNDFLVLAVGRTMIDFPQFRSQVAPEDHVITYPGANVGIAVATDDGLRVPVVLDVDRMTLAELAAASREVVQGARSGKAPNMGKGNFTISNLGATGIEEFAAIINPPEAAILAVASAYEGVKVTDGAMKATKLMTMTLSIDHRVVDGMIAAKFLMRLKEILESPEVLEND